MKTRIYNARLLTLENGDTDIINGELHVENDTITYAGAATPETQAFDEQINANGNVVMPGFKNAHAHAPMTFLRSFADDLPLYDWLHNKVFPMEAHLTPDDIYTLTKLALLEYVSGGITASFEMYAHPEQMARAAAEYGFKMVLCSPLNDFTSSVNQMRQEYETLNDYNPLISYKLGFHAEYTTSETLLKETAQLAEKYKAAVYAHGSETEKETAECIGRHGLTPTAYCDALGLYNYGGGIYHGVWLNDNDIEIIKRRGVSIITCPASNAKLASGIAPITKLLQNGVNIAAGTDGPASNNCLDMFREMFLITALAKLREGDAAVCSAADVLKTATCGGAYAMQLNDCGCIKKGNKADIIMLDLQMPNMQPINNIVKNIVYSGNRQNVVLTMINGKTVYKNGKFLTPDNPEDIYKKANEIITRIKQKM